MNGILRKPLAMLLVLTMFASALFVTPTLALGEDYSDDSSAQPDESVAEQPDEISIAALPDELIAAQALHRLGLFLGYGDDDDGNPVFGLEDSSSRLHGMIMLLRFLGIYDDALEGSYNCPFTDVGGTYNRSVTGYAFEHGLTKGVSATRFDPNGSLTAAMYLTYLLRALGYEDGVDFQWNTAWTLTNELGITDGRFNVANNTLTRGDMALVSLFSLEQPIKGSALDLIDSLIEAGAVQDGAAEIVANAIAAIAGPGQTPPPPPPPPPPPGAERLVYIAGVSSIRNETVGGVRWAYYAAWQDGVSIEGGLPLTSQPVSAHRFYTAVRGEDGRYTLRAAFQSGSGSSASPWAGSGQLRALTNIPRSNIGLGSVSGSIIDFGNGLHINISQAVVADTRPRQEQADNPITLNPRGVMNALDGNDFTRISLSVIYDNEARTASAVYITDALPGDVAAAARLVYFTDIVVVRSELVGNTTWNYYEGWRHGELIDGGIPLISAPTETHRFFLASIRPEGRYVLSDPFPTGNGSIASPWRSSSGFTFAMSGVTLTQANIAVAGILDFGAAAGTANLREAAFADLRPGEDQSDAPVTQSARGFTNALEEYASIKISIVFTDGGTTAATVYILEVST